MQDKLYLGNLDAVRDWGFAPEYVEGMWRMLQTAAGDDYVLATGHAMTVRDFCVAAFSRAGLDWEKHVDYDPRYDRPSEVDALIGDAGKAEQNLRWKAQTYGEDLVKVMVEADIQAVDDQLSGRGVRIDR
ncbi:MAG TPA: GDP-mannose 4,6-dehydratase [Terriglobales bacterium]|nr:GDP-mannose 4,6-dehydratase [Terriglobales bacterium]